MQGADFLIAGIKFKTAYEIFCSAVCKECELNQTAVDVLLFFANNPQYNTARDLCQLRGIKTGIASVTVENLIQADYLSRKPDAADRRVQRLRVTPKAQEAVEMGRAAQKAFVEALSDGISPEEWKLYMQLTEKLITNATYLAGTDGETAHKIKENS